MKFNPSEVIESPAISSNWERLKSLLQVIAYPAIITTSPVNGWGTKMVKSHSSDIKRLETRNKILLVGLANAGKTSIYIRCFENADPERIRSLTPTILFTSKKPKMGFSEEFIEFVDLGGQKQYIKHHLSDPSRFRNLRTVIFVVDVQEVSKLKEVKLYFSNVLTKIRDNKETPTMAVFLHKVDPKLKPELQDNVVKVIKELRHLFTSDIFFHVTSVFDDSVYEAMIQTLFMSLPKSVITQSITKDVLFTAHKTLLPMFKSPQETVTGGGPTPKRETLLAFAIPFGNALGKKLKDKWISYVTAANPAQVDTLPSEEDTTIQSKLDGFIIETGCPLLSAPGIELQPFYCEITKGILEGLCTLIGFDYVVTLQTQIRDGAPVCKFQLKRKAPNE